MCICVSMYMYGRKLFVNYIACGLILNAHAVIVKRINFLAVASI